MKKYIPIILLFVALFGCKQSFESNLDDDPIINKIFSSEEIEDLGKILTFFERQICSIDNMDQTRLSNCYISYFQRIEAAVKAEGIVINISFEEQKKLYKQINKSTFDEIWTFCKCRNSTSGDILKCICFKNGSKYANFLSELERKNPVIHDYYASFKESGDVKIGRAHV